MKKIIAPIDKSTLKSELKRIKFIRKTSRGGNELYSFTHKDSPILMDEIGRLREESFRGDGGGSGKSVDIDKYDIADYGPFRQLLLWDPDADEVIGGYRYLLGSEIEKDKNGIPLSPTSKLFTLSTRFLNDFWDQTMELGRSFVQPMYRPAVNRKKGIYALDNLWDGLGSMVTDFPEMRYYFGKMTMYPSFNKKARDLILYFIEKHFPDKEQLVTSLYPVSIEHDRKVLGELLPFESYKENFKMLRKHVQEQGEFIPPLFTAYMNLSNTMKSFGTAVNASFGNVEETGIMITIEDVFIEKKKRYVFSYNPS